MDDSLVCRVEFIPPCIPDSYLYRITSTKCRINTVVSPDDGHIVAQNMQRREINVLRKILHQVGFIYKAINVGYLGKSWFPNMSTAYMQQIVFNSIHSTIYTCLL
jgi:hypothetical protein